MAHAQLPCALGNGRWHQALAALYLQMNAGLQDAFSVYAFQYRQALGLSELQLAGLGTAKDAGNALFGAAAGFFLDRVPLWWTVAASALVNVLGFTAIWGLYTGAVTASYPVMCCAFACAYACGAGYSLGSIKYTLANFPEVRGMVASFLKPMDGLCAALYTQLHLCVAPTVAGFLLLQASLPPAVALCALPFLRLYRNTEDSDMERNATVRTFEVAAVLTAALALYCLALSAIESVASAHTRIDDTGVMFSLMAVLVASFAALPSAHAAWRAREGPAPGGSDSERTPLGAAATSPGRYGATSAPGSFAPLDGADTQEHPTTEMARFNAAPNPGASAAAGALDDVGMCCVPLGDGHTGGGGHGHFGAEGHGYGSSDDEGHEAAAAADADAAAEAADGGATSSAAGQAAPEEEEVFGAAKYYEGGSATLADALATPDYWLTVGIMFFNNAIAYSLLNNLGQLCHSLGAGGATAGLTALASCANCLGRIVGGQASERTLYGFSMAEFYSSVRARNARAARITRSLLPRGSKAARAAAVARMTTSAAAAAAAATAAGGGVPRSVWLLANAAAELAGCVLIGLATGPFGLFCGVPLVSAAFGAQNTLLVSVFHERFGHKNFAGLIGLAGLCLLPASLLFSTLLASYLYDQAAREQALATGAGVGSSTALYCSGPLCFRKFFLIMAGVAVAQCMVAALHWRRMGRFYLRLAAKRANEKNA